MLQKQQHILLKGEIRMIHLLKLELKIFPDIISEFIAAETNFPGKQCRVKLKNQLNDRISPG